MSRAFRWAVLAVALAFAASACRRAAATRDDGATVAAADAMSVDERASVRAWQEGYAAGRCGLLEPLRERDLVLVRAPFEHVARWFRDHGANVVDDAIGGTVTVGRGAAFLCQLHGPSWVLACDETSGRTWPRQLSGDLHAPVLELADAERPRHYRLCDDGRVVEEFTSGDGDRAAVKFVSMRRAPPPAIDDDVAFVDATLRELGVLAPPLRFGQFVPNSVALAPGVPLRPIAPVDTWTVGGVPLRCEVPLRRCSFVTW